MRLRYDHAAPVLLVLCAALLFTAGCASASKRFEQGQELEERGDYAGAVERYVQSLRKDADQPEVRERLAEAAAVYVEATLAAADRAHTEGRFAEAAEAYRTLDLLIDDADEVDVPVVLPETYADDRRTRFDDALAALVADAEAAFDAGRWSQALALYDRLDRYDPAPGYLDDREDARRRIYLAWADDDLAAGRYRDAAAHADDALALLEPDSDAARDALDIRAAALERGTMYVAVVPFRNETRGEGAPPAFLAELNDVLYLDHWSVPPPFVAVADPVLVGRELRRRDLRRGDLSRNEAARVGRAVGADFVIVGAVERFEATEEDVRSRTERARTRDGVDTTYTVRSGRLRYSVEVAYEVVDVARRRVVDRGRASESETGRFELAVYDGDPRDLRLDRGERRLFDERRLDDEARDIEAELIDDLAPRIAERVFDDVLRRVP